MAPHILVVNEDPKSSVPNVTLRPVSDDVQGVSPAGLDIASTLLVREWPALDAGTGGGASAIALWPGPVIFVPEDAGPEEAPNLARVILASADVEGIQALAEWVAGMPALARSHLYLLIVMEQDEDPDGEELRAVYERAQEKLAALATSLRLLGLHTNWEVRFGALGEEVTTLAQTTGTCAVAVQRPLDLHPPTDFARLASYIRQHGARLCLLVGPRVPDREQPDAPVSGNGHY